MNVALTLCNHKRYDATECSNFSDFFFISKWVTPELLTHHRAPQVSIKQHHIKAQQT